MMDGTSPHAAAPDGTRGPASAEDTRDRILDAAEQVFSDAGFDGAGMKAIALGAGVAQGLLHYHFGHKEGLYAAVIARRSAAINSARLHALDAVDPADAHALERVLDALVRPPLGPEGGGAAYARIFGALAAGTPRDAALVAEHYDPTARRFIAAIAAAVPGLTREHAAWGYSFAIGALVSVVGRSGRSERLGGRAGPPAETEEIVGRLVRFLAAGIRAGADPPA